MAIATGYKPPKLAGYGSRGRPDLGEGIIFKENAKERASGTSQTDNSGANGASGGAMPPDDDGPNSKYERTTKGRSVENRQTDVSRQEFENNLRDSGWKESKSADGKAAVFEKDGARYVVRDNAKSTAGSTADFYSSGGSSPNVKIRLGGP